MSKAIHQFDKDFPKENIVDTLSTSLANVKGCMDNLVKNLNEKSEMIHRDLVEPLELYYKHYQSTNSELLKQANQFWTSYHQEHTNMLFAKENYYNQMFVLHKHQQQYQEAIAVAFGMDPASVRGPNKPPQFEEMINGEGIQDKKMSALQSKADIARHEYEQGIDKLNLTIDLFDTSYRPILNRVQDSDDSQISFTKYNLEKLARYIEQTGRDLKTNAEEIS
jgi:hypothetical protein